MTEELVEMRARLLPGGKVRVQATTWDYQRLRRYTVTLDKHDPTAIKDMAGNPREYATSFAEQTPEGGSGT